MGQSATILNRTVMVSGAAALGTGPVRDRVTALEWQARVELAALYRLVDHFRWTDTIYTHISLRVPGEEAFLINPFGYLYEEITASSLVKVTARGDVLDDPVGLGINKAGYVIHGALHAARPDVHCVLHTHTRDGVAVSAQDHGLLPISQHASFFMGRIGYHDFEGVAVDEDEQARLAANLGPHAILILRNHGLLVAGANPAHAFYLINTLERACEIQIAALGGGTPVRFVSDRAVKASQDVLESFGTDFSRDWAAMLRLVKRVAPDFET
jgi:ribulose-5-phosphate 4-epimerase/fuculose-1-phosphate aldolase